MRYRIAHAKVSATLDYLLCHDCSGPSVQRMCNSFLKGNIRRYRHAVTIPFFAGPDLRRLTMKLLYSLALLCASHGTLAAEPPNVVYIISDDQAWLDFGFMGNDRVHTPNIDALAKRSARFVNGYVPSSVCRPSLVTLLTGLYPHQHQVHFNHGPPGNAGYNRMASRDRYEETRQREFGLIRKLETLPAILARECGYRSLQTGKFWEGHWRNGGFTQGMTTFEPPPHDQTFGGVRKLANGERVAHGNGDAGLQIGRRTMQPILDFIDDCQAESTPWLVWYAPYLPHQPHDSPQRFFELARSHRDVGEHELPYFASIAQFDDTVGTLVRHVEAKGMADKTVFVLVSDNGWRPSRQRERNRPQEFAHTRNSKRAPFDDGLRTPILIRWDGVVKPATHAGLVSSIDLMPTLLEAAGTATRRTKLPGISLLPTARGEATIPADRSIFGAIYPGDATSLGHPERDVAYRWMRQRNLKLIVPRSQAAGKKAWGAYVDSVALFDVSRDPFERMNLARSPTHGEDLDSLRKQLDVWWTPAAESP